MHNKGNRCIPRTAVCYIGSAMFLATGMVAIADQPLNIGRTQNHCYNCTSGGDATPHAVCSSYNRNNSCTGSLNCSQCNCEATIPYGDYADCVKKP